MRESGQGFAPVVFVLGVHYRGNANQEPAIMKTLKDIFYHAQAVHAFRHAQRTQLTDQQRAKLFLDRGGRCHRCERKLGPADKWSDEHLIALECGGTNEMRNRDISCSWCKPLKDAEDHGKAAKIRAVAVNHIVPSDQRQKRGKALPGTKRSGWRHKMDGTWERR